MSTKQVEEFKNEFSDYAIDIITKTFPKEIVRLNAVINQEYHSEPESESTASSSSSNKRKKPDPDDFPNDLLSIISRVNNEAQHLSLFLSKLQTWLALKSPPFDNEVSESLEGCIKEIQQSSKACDNIIENTLQDLEKGQHFVENNNGKDSILFQHFENIYTFRYRQTLVDLRNIYLICHDTLQKNLTNLP